jgi:hypothetical protein
MSKIAAIHFVMHAIICEHYQSSQDFILGFLCRASRT